MASGNRNIVVIGGGAAGMSAASKARRTDPSAMISVVESGSYVSYAECGIPYYIEGIVREASDLLHYPLEEFTSRRKINVITGKRVINIAKGNNCIKIEDGTRIPYDSLIIATGASPNIPEEFRHVGRGIRSLESGIIAKESINGKESVTIAGAGILGTELASSLAVSGKKVTLISKYGQVLPALDGEIGKIIDSEVRKRINVEYNSKILEIERLESGLRIKTDNGMHTSDEVIFATGIKPNSDLAADAGIKIDRRNAILADGRMETSIHGVYAAGDVASVKNRITGNNEMIPLAQVANKTGRVAGANSAGGSMEFPGATGTSLVKIFDYEIGFTGLNEKTARSLGYDFSSTFITAGSRANYYPGKKPVYVKIIYEKKSGRLIGGQVAGTDGAAWRLNTLATAIYGGFTVEDLFYDDLGYTPPFGPVWDPLVIAGSVSMRE